MELGKHFDELGSAAQWIFILTLTPEDKEKVEIFLDNDDTSISFGEIEEDGDGYVAMHHFKNDIGDRQGAFDLLEGLGFKVQGV